MPKTDTDALLADLNSRLVKLVDVARAEGREGALAEIRALVGGGATSGGTEGPTRPAAKAEAKPAKPKKKRKNSWAGLTPEQKADRVRKMQAGRGIQPVAERKPATKRATTKKRKNPWAGLTPEQKLKRVNAIRKGRGLPLKKKL